MVLAPGYALGFPGWVRSIHLSIVSGGRISSAPLRPDVKTVVVALLGIAPGPAIGASFGFRLDRSAGVLPRLQPAPCDYVARAVAVSLISGCPWRAQ